MLHAQCLFCSLFDSPLCTLHRLSHLPFHSPDLHLHLPCGLVRGEVPSALQRHEELGTSADNNPLTLLVAPTSKVVGPRLQSERIEEQIGNIPVSPSVEDTVEVVLSLPQEQSSTACCRGRDVEHREISACTRTARVQEIPEIQVTERVQVLTLPERIEEVRRKLFVAEETTQSVAEFSDSAPGRVFSACYINGCHTQRRPRPTLPLQLALFLMNGLHICPLRARHRRSV